MLSLRMSEGDRERWDERHLSALGREPEDPDPFAASALERLPTPAEGAALDLACGTGRHALELARRGWLVAAWDVSPVALEILRKRASMRRLLVATREVDLTGAHPLRPPRVPFDLVLVVDYLERSLLPGLAELVRPGGHLVYATFTSDHPGEHPSRRFRLERGELARGVPGFTTLWQEEAGGRAGLVARR